MDNLLVNVWLLIFFAVVLFQPSTETTLNKLRVKINGMSGFVLLNLAGLLGLVLFIFTQGVHGNSPLNLILKSGVALLVLGNVIWSSLFVKQQQLVLLFLLGISAVVLRVAYPHTITHNIVIILGISWVGSFLTTLKVVTVKRFVVISILWALYDVCYVWLTPLAENVNGAAQGIGFPLAIITGEALIGTADLLWAGIFLTLLPTLKWKVRGVGLLLVSNTLLIYLINLGYSFAFFPLLVFWVPLGLAFMYLVKKGMR